MNIITENNDSPIVSMYLNIDTGSVYESPEIAGATYIQKKALLGSTHNRSIRRQIQECDKLGQNIATFSSRDNLSITAESTVEYIDQALGTIADLCLYPLFDNTEMIEVFHDIEKEQEAQNQMYDIKINENIHLAAFNGKGLGSTIYPNTNSLHRLQEYGIGDWYYHSVQPQRMTLSAVGVNHEKFVEQAQEQFVFDSDITKCEQLTKQPSIYQGGESRIHDPNYNGLTHFAIAFEGPSWYNDDVYAASIQQTYLGGGGSFSAGGPGKGLYSIQYRNVLCQNPYIESITSFNSIFEDTSLFGVYCTAESDHMDSVVENILNELSKMDQITETNMNNAKKQLRSTILMNLESHLNRAEDMARHLAIYKSYNQSQVLDKVDSVTIDDVKNVAKQLLQSPPSIACYGNVLQVPKHSTIAYKFH